MRPIAAIMLALSLSAAIGAETVVNPTVSLDDKRPPATDVVVTVPSSQAAAQHTQTVAGMIVSGLAFVLYFLESQKAAAAAVIRTNILKAVPSAHWVVQEMKNMGLIRPGAFANIEDAFFKMFQERFVLDHGHDPDEHAENVAYGILTKEFNSITPHIKA